VSEGKTSTTLGRRKLRWAQGYLRGGPLAATWDLSRCGTAACLYCEQDVLAETQWAAAEVWQRVIRSLSDWGTLVVSFGGGQDPFLHPELSQIVAEVSRAHFAVITSSGRGVSAERARALWDAGLVEAAVVLHSAEPATHDAIAGWPGAHASALRALRALAETRQHGWQRVNASVTLGAEGVAGVAAIVAQVHANGTGVIVEPPLDGPGGRPKVPERYSEGLLALRRQSGVLRNSAAYLAQIDRALAGGLRGCRAGRRSVHVDQRGRVFRCMRRREQTGVLGDLCSETSEVVLARLKRRVDADDCTQCWATLRGEIECLAGWRVLWTVSSWLWS
jgi:MoaA/NifB/PqqE/SkfB family radical SAM enzyme